MSVAARLAGFAAILALVFGGAALAGGRIDADPAAPEPEAAGAAGMGAMAGAEDAHGADGTAGAPQTVRGLAVSADGLTLELARTTARPGEPFDLAFRIAGRRGRTVRAFDVEHTKRMHLIVVRRDMTAFQHLHPVQRPDGSWSVPATLRDPGSYRVFADFSAGGTARTLAADLTADGAVRSRALPAPASVADAGGGLRVRLAPGTTRAGEEADLRFTVTRGGRPVAVEDYLGAKGHLVALREGDLAFLHVHPDERRLQFMAELPTAGRYRLFLQFKAGGRVHTAAFSREVSR
jgi:hypothetical protein